MSPEPVRRVVTGIILAAIAALAVDCTATKTCATSSIGCSTRPQVTLAHAIDALGARKDVKLNFCFGTSFCRKINVYVSTGGAWACYDSNLFEPGGAGCDVAGKDIQLTLTAFTPGADGVGVHQTGDYPVSFKFSDATGVFLSKSGSIHLDVVHDESGCGDASCASGTAVIAAN